MMLSVFPKDFSQVQQLPKCIAAYGASDGLTQPLGKLHIWEVASWDIVTWEVALGKSPLGKYLTPYGPNGQTKEGHKVFSGTPFRTA